MKTTLDISDALFDAAKDLAQQRQTTMRSLMEEGLRRVLADAQVSSAPAFKLQDARVRGRGVLVADPRDWQAMEDVHVAQRILKPVV